MNIKHKNYHEDTFGKLTVFKNKLCVWNFLFLYLMTLYTFILSHLYCKIYFINTQLKQDVYRAQTIRELQGQLACDGPVLSLWYIPPIRSQLWAVRANQRLENWQGTQHCPKGLPKLISFISTKQADSRAQTEKQLAGNLDNHLLSFNFRL